ncbi:unnamed protein product [Amoebophrya sp. A25]|nr:unnamed protein product [Amoebophrya sp. A25]|eukprot:GSA25T00005961001.1
MRSSTSLSSPVGLKFFGSKGVFFGLLAVHRAVVASVGTAGKNPLSWKEEHAKAWREETRNKAATLVQRLEKDVAQANAALKEQKRVKAALAPLVDAAVANVAKAKAVLDASKKVAAESVETASAKAKAKAEATIKSLRASGDAYLADLEADREAALASAKKVTAPPQTEASAYEKYLQSMVNRGVDVSSAYAGMAVHTMTDGKALLRKARLAAERASKREVPNPEGTMAWAHAALASANEKKQHAQRYYDVAGAVSQSLPAWQQKAENER